MPYDLSSLEAVVELKQIIGFESSNEGQYVSYFKIFSDSVLTEKKHMVSKKVRFEL
jgi:hypothetical protein